jgi:heat shock protein HslJ
MSKSQPSRFSSRLTNKKEHIMARFQALTFIAAVAISLVFTGACHRGDRTTGDTPGDASPPPSTAVSIMGTKWVLIDLGGQGALGGALGGAEDNLAARPQLQFDAREKRVSGSTGINRLSGPYEQSGGQSERAAAVKFGPMATTKMAGPPELMKQESEFLKALDATVLIEAQGNSLTLRDAAGNALARFEIMK